MTVRDATPADAGRCAEIYGPYVTGSAVSFELEPPGVTAMTERITGALAQHAWFVAEQEDRVLGYAYAGPYKSRAAYRWTAEVSVYVDGEAQGAGVGRSLYEALLARLAERGFRTAVATMTLPNPASAALHRATGFTEAGVLSRVGWKAGRWHDVALWRRDLEPGGGAPSDPPAEPA